MRLSKRRAKGLTCIYCYCTSAAETLGDECDIYAGCETKDERKAVDEALEWIYDQAFKRLGNNNSR